MFVRGLSLVVIALFFGACGPRLTMSSTPNGPLKPANIYEHSGELTLLTTRSEVSSRVHNVVQFEGEGDGSVYLAHLNFKSKNHRRLRILISEPKVEGCAKLQWSYALQNSQGTSALDSTQQALLEPQKNYSLVVQAVSGFGCERVKAELQLSVWAGQESADPVLAYACRGNQTGAVDFLVGARQGEAYARVTNPQKFLSNKSYCGVQVENAAQASCRSEDNSNKLKMLISCQASSAQIGFSSQTEFNLQAGTAKVSCARNGEEIHLENFSSCRRVVVDRGAYRGLSND